MPSSGFITWQVWNASFFSTDPLAASVEIASAMKSTGSPSKCARCRLPSESSS
jgi:hypothetical protein